MDLSAPGAGGAVNAPPSSWQPREIQSFSAFVTKGATPTTYGFDWEDDGVVFLRSECVAEKGLDLGQSTFISPKAHAALKRGEVRSGDILMTITGNVGRVVRLRNDFGIANINQHIARIRVADQDVNPSFVYHFLSQRRIRSAYELITTGQAYPQISLQQVRETLVPLPPLPEQNAIAKALDEMDRLTSELVRSVNKKRDLKQAAIQQLLGKAIRLAGFARQWSEVALADVGRFTSGVGFPVMFQGASQGIYPFFKVSDMNNQGNELLMSNANNWISEETRRRLGARTIPPCSIIFAKVGAAIFLERKRILKLESCIDNNMMAYTVDSRSALAKFVFYVLQATKLGNLVAQSALPSLSAKALGALRFALPPLEEQEAIVQMLEDIDGEIWAFEALRQKNEDMKQGMMQELLTGRTRLV